LFRPSRRQLLVAATGGLLYGGLRYGKARVARPAPPSGPLSEEARALVTQAWAGLNPRQVLDVHVHVVGLGAGGTGCEVGERLAHAKNPLEAFKFSIYLEAAGITDEARADAQYAERLTSLLEQQAPHGRALLFAFDRAHDEAGRPLPDDTEFYTPTEYVLALARAQPQVFVPATSIHPARADAVDALERAVAQGAMAVKWLPNAMNIDPASPRYDAFYDALARLRVPLITHAGEEKAVHAEARQRLGNPLKLRRALERGATVVVAHCASLGQNPDLDAPGQPLADNFGLFLRLMREPAWEGRLFGEISAMTLVNRLGTPLSTVLSNDALQRRLLNGSDYPLPAINVLIQTRALVQRGFLTAEERRSINEVGQHDPLLFDFVLKRTLRWNDGARTCRLADAVFTARPEVFPRLQA
jgi:mannonate dehydratase